MLGLLSVFRSSLTEKSLAQLITEPQALITLRNYSLLQRENGDDGPSYKVHPVVRGYVESKLSAEKIQGYHLQAVEFHYEQTGALVHAIYDFLAMIGRREVAKALLRQSIAPLEGISKYITKGSLATLQNHEGKWQEALATFDETL